MLTTHITSTVNEIMQSAVGTEKRKERCSLNSKTRVPKSIAKYFAGQEAVPFGQDRQPLHFCVYRKEVRDYVFLPPGYGKRYYNQHKHSNPPFCKKCRLQPCLNAEYASEIYGEGHKLATYIDANIKDALSEKGQAIRNDKISNNLRNRVRKIMEKLYGKEYAEKKGIPRCVWEKINYAFPGSEYFSSNSDEDSDTDSDNENIDPDKMFNPKYF